jgi:hypothetical protein
MKYGKFTVYRNDRVTISTPHGQVTGRANGLLFFPDHCVIDIGGRHGTPAVADASNIIAVRRAAANGVKS